MRAANDRKSAATNSSQLSIMRRSMAAPDLAMPKGLNRVVLLVLSGGEIDCEFKPVT